MATDAIFEDWKRGSLIWLPERGMGYYPVNRADEPYDAGYFDKYRAYASTDMGRALTAARVDLVSRYYDGELVDVGIGCGAFVEARPDTFGFDVNPAAVAWLWGAGLYRDLYRDEIPAATFWDSLEHIEDPGAALACVEQFAFVSLPIFDDCEHVRQSKHFRRDEHRWYWTRAGFVAWASACGFETIARSRMESDLGRDGIETFVLRRMG